MSIEYICVWYLISFFSLDFFILTIKTVFEWKQIILFITPFFTIAYFFAVAPLFAIAPFFACAPFFAFAPFFAIAYFFYIAPFSAIAPYSVTKNLTPPWISKYHISHKLGRKSKDYLLNDFIFNDKIIKNLNIFQGCAFHFEVHKIIEACSTKVKSPS